MYAAVNSLFRKCLLSCFTFFKMRVQVWLIAPISAAALGDESRRTGATVRHAGRHRKLLAALCICAAAPKGISHSADRPLNGWCHPHSSYVHREKGGGGLTYLSLNLDRLFLSCSNVVADGVYVSLNPSLSAFTKYLPPLCQSISFALPLSVFPSLPQLPSTLQAVATCALQSACPLLNRPYSLLPPGLPVSLYPPRVLLGASV